MDYGDPAAMQAYQQAYQAQMQQLQQSQSQLSMVATNQTFSGGNQYSPYGGSKGSKGKGKGKDGGKGKKGKSKVPEAKPVVNPNQLNASKEAMSGGISFKNIFQEKLSKQIHRPIQPGDVVYTCTRVQGGRHCVLTLPCLGEGHTYESDRPGTDEKMAGQIASSKALEALYPDVYEAVMEAYSSARAEVEATQAIGGEVVKGTDPLTGEPKGELNNRVLAVIGRPCNKEDVIYDCKWDRNLNGYVCTLTLNALDGGAGTAVYTSDLVGCNDSKLAEKDAAKKALEIHKDQFDEALREREEKKAQKARAEAKAKGKGKTGGFGGFGKGKGKGGGYHVAPSMGFFGTG